MLKQCVLTQMAGEGAQKKMSENDKTVGKQRLRVRREEIIWQPQAYLRISASATIGRPMPLPMPAKRLFINVVPAGSPRLGW